MREQALAEMAGLPVKLGKYARMTASRKCFDLCGRTPLPAEARQIKTIRERHAIHHYWQTWS
jgi:hypothetical protein